MYDTPNTYLTLADVAHIANISRQRMYVLMSELRGPPIAVQPFVNSASNSKMLFDAYVVAQWIIIRNKTNPHIVPVKPALLQAVGMENVGATSIEIKKLITKLKCRRTQYHNKLDLDASITKDNETIAALRDAAYKKAMASQIEALLPKQSLMTIAKWKQRVAAKQSA